MGITPEQFNKIALKEDLVELKEEMNSKFSEVLNVVDAIAKKLDNLNTEKFANLAVHDRIQADVNEVRGQVGMDIKNQTMN